MCAKARPPSLIVNDPDGPVAMCVQFADDGAH